jgi:hypothetical protein
VVSDHGFGGEVQRAPYRAAHDSEAASLSVVCPGAQGRAVARRNGHSPLGDRVADLTPNRYWTGIEPSARQGHGWTARFLTSRARPTPAPEAIRHTYDTKEVEAVTEGRLRGVVSRRSRNNYGSLVLHPVSGNSTRLARGDGLVNAQPDRIDAVPGARNTRPGSVGTVRSPDGLPLACPALVPDPRHTQSRRAMRNRIDYAPDTSLRVASWVAFCSLNIVSRWSTFVRHRPAEP